MKITRPDEQDEPATSWRHWERLYSFGNNRLIKLVEPITVNAFYFYFDYDRANGPDGVGVTYYDSDTEEFKPLAYTYFDWDSTNE
jgi:hypothetical protein